MSLRHGRAGDVVIPLILDLAALHELVGIDTFGLGPGSVRVFSSSISGFERVDAW
ncbi:hypothetical protein ACIGB8_10515 [Promicromonospora sukumoe]|uniref:hypothetical protein n=1 Tax=Promicromonospora sukumoe TaxID=88382 RepID=UPI0037CC4D8B